MKFKLFLGSFVAKSRLHILRRSFYRKSLVILLAFAFFPIVVTGIINYAIGTQQVKNEVVRTHNIQIKQAYNEIDQLLVHLEAMSGEWIFNPIFTNNLKEMDFSRQFEKHNEIMGGLRSFESTSPLSNDIRLYLKNAHGDMVFSTKNGRNYVTDSKELSYYERLMEDARYYYWIKTENNEQNGQGSNLVLIQRVPGMSGSPYGLLMIYLNKDAISKIVGQLNLDGLGAAFIIDDKGGYISSGVDKSGTGTSLNDKIRNEVIKAQDTRKSFTYNLNDESYLVTYETLSRNGWCFVLATPISRLMAPVIFFSKMIFINFIFVLLISIAASFLASGRIYKPIHRLIGIVESGNEIDDKKADNDEIRRIEERWKKLSVESKKLKAKLEQNQDSLKKSFLLQLVQGHLYYFNDEEINEQFRQYWWEPEDRIFSVLVIRITDFIYENSLFAKGDEQLVTFAAANIIEEILMESGSEIAVLNFHDLSIASVLSYSSRMEREEINKGILHLAEESIYTLSKYLKIQVSVVKGSMSDSLKKLPQIVDEARKALRYRDINKKGQTIDLENIRLSGEPKVFYPYGVEKNILETLRMGMEQEALQEIGTFIHKIKASSGKEMIFKQSVMQLLGSILHLINKSGINSEKLCPYVDLYEELIKVKEPTEIFDFFAKHLIRPFIDEFNKSIEKEDEEEKLISKVTDILDMEYNTPISLETCADRVGITAYNLSVKFKEYAGVNFIDYLTNVRMKKAKELLNNSSLTINEIAAAVGYQPSYFVRAFKRLEGVTPGQFRYSKTT